MRVFFLFVLLFSSVVKSSAQAPQFINYQAVARYTNSNLPIPHQPVIVNFKIREGGVLGRVLFNENHSDTTDDCGLFNLRIGSIQTAAFKQIDWSTGGKFLEVNINGVVTGISELSSTPYSLYALYAESAKSSLDWKNIGDSILFATGKKIGINNKTPQAQLDLTGYMRIKGDNTNPTKFQMDAYSKDGDNWITSFDEAAHPLWILNFAYRAENNMFGLFSEKIQDYVWNVSTDGNVGIKTRPSASYALSVNGEMKVNGSASVECLTIRGGCDWYEEANATAPIPAGYVAAVDPVGAINSVKVSSHAYDKMVTGVVSGAGGVNPGIGLQQQGVLEGNTKIAMGGKVKVYVTGLVQPGDLLTSSNQPGFAMAVKNRKKAFGAVLGKALSIPDTDGLVLMQVMMH